MNQLKKCECGRNFWTGGTTCIFCHIKSGEMQDFGVNNPISTHDATEQQSHDTAEQQSKTANSGGERLVGLIVFIVGIAMLSLGSPINSFGSLFLILLGFVLMLVSFVFMIFGRWGLFLGW
jgi:hypothetical protein